jgi:hypothetical protein
MSSPDEDRNSPGCAARPDNLSSCARSSFFWYSAPARPPVAPAITHRMIPAAIQPVPRGVVVPREREPEPQDDRPDEAHADDSAPEVSDAAERDPLVDVRERPGRDDEDPEQHHRRHQRERAQFVERQDPVVEAHAAMLNLPDAIHSAGPA